MKLLVKFAIDTFFLHNCFYHFINQTHSPNSDESLSESLSGESSSEESLNGKSSSEESLSKKSKVDETGGGLVRVKY